MSIILDRPGATDADRQLRADLVDRAAKLVPLLAANAKRTEDDRRVPEENIRAIEEAGLFTIMQPKRFGGLQVDFRTKLEVTRELARGCGSTAWATSLMNVCAWFTGMWGEQAQQDVWGENPRNRVAGVFAPSATARVVDGGLVVTGKWGWASGCLHSQWALVGTPAAEGEGRSYDQGMVLIPMADLTVEDTWFVVGMRGTGSNTLVADEVFVPEHRFISVPKMTVGEVATPFKDEALYRSPFVPGAAIILAGPQLGLAQAALDLVVEKAPRRGISYTFYENQTQAPVVQLAVARAASLVDTAHLLAYRAAAEIDENAHLGVFPDYTARARARMDVGQAIVTAREAIRELVTAHGASSFAESSPMQRIWRDSEVASRHAVANPEISAEVYGRALLGIHEGVSPLV
ncbi:acyl-CoA dehydrogenase family protein [Amycolatopsis rhabdoformis]|uniref:Acyl-CoA dehydrogenase family protein n=1 Tax=Amycolatopsis rhabdoformis TaxID=1448059 RepID=A0ABZ1IJW7_9PSEU|nr:acyl-CoA dehydrogenase family protein [Amycolatopsis rhabdoformis]WSE34722.1 acyl-CoA dehydrogenase family protein [Amycolatopsis rhabdoformis]